MGAIDPLPDRSDLARFVGDIEKIERIFESWEDTQRRAVDAYRRTIEELQGEALRRLVRALKDDPAALAAMKRAASDEIVYAVMRKHGILKASVSERVEEALDGVRPMLASHGGDVELVSVRPPAIEVRFTGACDGCPASALTFHAGVKKAVEAACPEITEIIQVRGAGGGGAGNVNFISPFAHDAIDGWRLACRLDDIPEGGVLAKEIGGESVILSRAGGSVSCFQNACAHLGLELDRGLVDDGVISCPHHGFRYDLATGECLTAPEVQLRAHMVKVTGRSVEVRLAP